MIKKYSGAGEHHSFDSNRNQDAIATASDKRYIAVSLADGVSTCSEAKAGANIACERLNELLKNKASFFFRFDEKQIADVVISHILYELKKQALKDNTDIEEYSSTISSVLIDTKLRKALLINLGDGIIMGTSQGNVEVLSMPCDSRYGCCVTTTKNAMNSVSVKTIDTRLVDSIIICSDGAWREMFHKTRMKAEPEKLLINNEFEDLGEFLKQQNCFDDFSFVSVDFENSYGRKFA